MEDFFMITRKRIVATLLFPLFGMMFLTGQTAIPADSAFLYTAYTKISVSPGESIEFPIEAINNSKEIQIGDITIEGLPRGWNYSLKAGTWKIGQLSVIGGERKSFSLQIDIPLKVNKGSYRFRVMAGAFTPLPLSVIVSEQGTFKTEFTSDQANMQGHASSLFTFNANLKNRTSDKQSYALIAEPARGWNVTFKSNYQPVTSVSVEPNATQAITIEVKAPESVEAGKYRIPVTASTSTTSAFQVLEVVITGTYNMELTTPTGLLSTSITAGDTKRVEMAVNNTGSSELTEINFTATAPVNWEVTFDPKKVEKLQPGATVPVFAIIKADKKAITGDYATTIEAKTPEVSSKISFRISVETPLLWGWVGVLIIIAALGSVYYLFRKYGRR
jgi:uncharacterized membrane protein